MTVDCPRSQAKEIVYLRTQVNRLLAKHTGRPVEQIERDFDRDRWMSAEDARVYGLIDQVIAAPHAGVLAAATTNGNGHAE